MKSRNLQRPARTGFQFRRFELLQLILISVHKLLAHRIVRFLVFGISAAAINLLLMFLFIDVMGWKSTIDKNIANAISLELSLLYSFFVYRGYVWNEPAGNFKSSFSSQILRYHGASATTNTTRFIVIFPCLDWLGFHHLINTVLGIGFGCLINYTLSNKYVFAASTTQCADSANQIPVTDAFSDDDSQCLPVRRLGSDCESYIGELNVRD